MWIGYLLTLAPSVTFWDSGEFITAARTLGIPHPPGTPLFVLIAHVWGLIVPFGAYAWRINLLSATCSAMAAALWFLIAEDTLTRVHGDIDPRSARALALLGGGAAALLSAFSFSNWQNSTETEVYSLATLAIALVAWLAVRWRAMRGGPGAAKVLLAGLYVGALAMSVHPMGLLVGPAMVALLLVTIYMQPLADADARRREAGQVMVVASAWLLITGLGLASLPIAMIGAAALLGAGARSMYHGERSFVTVAVLVVTAGAAVFLFLLLRAQQHPLLDQGTPDNWHGLLDVIRRAQYAPRTPFDDPLVPHGSMNPGRTLTLLAYQFAGYAQYFDWQWAASLGDLARASVPRLLVTLGMVGLGVRGARAQRRADPGSFALIATLFVVTGPLLVLYLNFKPGPSIGWDRWLALADHEVRDRDYFFVASFIAWSIWVAIGLTAIAREAASRLTPPRRNAAIGVFAVALVPVMLGWGAASRRQTPEATLARDFAFALLQSVPPNGVLFTYGDNDTFPLWYLQQVEHVRQDVTVICLSLAQAPWYINQLATQQHVEPGPADLASVWRGEPVTPVTWRVHRMDPAGVLRFRPFVAASQLTLDLGRHGVATVAAGSAVYPADLTLFEVLRTNAGRRPIAWSVTAADALHGLGPNVVQEGLALVMPISLRDSDLGAPKRLIPPGDTPLDIPTTQRLIAETWHFEALERDGSDMLEGNIRAIAGTIAGVYAQLGAALVAHGDTAGALPMLRRAVRVAGDSSAAATLQRLHH